MSEELLDDDGYPTELALEVIRNWVHTDPHGCFAFCRDLWRYPHYFLREIHPAHIQWRVSTGGWGGNEDIIKALRDNQRIWAITWQEIKRGGHYVFQHKKLELP